MALFNLDIEKELDGEFWTNRYILEAGSLGQASADGQNIVNFERAITSSQVTFTRYRVSDQVPLTDVFQIVALGVLGLRVLTGPLLPLFNVVRVDFTAELGRPSRKYLRGVLGEDDIVFNSIAQPTQVLVFDLYALPLFQSTVFVDVDGQALVGASVIPNVAMRQLRRGSRRRQTPVLGPAS